MFLFDRSGLPVASLYEELPQYFPQPGWVEHDPEEIWNSVLNLMKQVLMQEQVAPHEIAGIGIIN